MPAACNHKCSPSSQTGPPSPSGHARFLKGLPDSPTVLTGSAWMSCCSRARLCDWRYMCALDSRVSYDKAQFTITRAVGLLFLTFTLVLPVLAREQAENQASVDLTESPQANASGRMLFWQWANFALLAGGLIYLAKKYAPPYFVKRSREIRKGIIEAEEF